MTEDLFEDNAPKKLKLREFILNRSWTSTADVDKWGLENHHIRARRDAQDMASAGVFRRMTDEEKARYVMRSSVMGYWVRNDFT